MSTKIHRDWVQLAENLPDMILALSYGLCWHANANLIDFATLFSDKVFVYNEPTLEQT